jgi:hypothetical protein
MGRVFIGLIRDHRTRVGRIKGFKRDICGRKSEGENS